MLTSEEQRALLALCALVLAGALLGWLDARQPRFLRLTLGDSLALGAPAPAPDDSAAAPGGAPPPAGPAPGDAGGPPAGPDAAAAAGATLSGTAASVREKIPFGPDGKLNLNAASADALEELPGVGPKTAQRILEDRRVHGPYRRITDLQRVKGIGPKTLARIAPHVTVGAARDSAR